MRGSWSAAWNDSAGDSGCFRLSYNDSADRVRQFRFANVHQQVTVIDQYPYSSDKLASDAS